jgi:cold shock CspA family protein
MKTRGRIKFYDVRRGFGFVSQNSGPDIFGSRALLDRNPRIGEGDVVEFDIIADAKGRLQASSVQLGD